MRLSVCLLVISVFTGCATNQSGIVFPKGKPGLRDAVPDPEMTKQNRLAAPKYPRFAVRDNIQGGVCFKLAIEADGTPSEIEVVDSQPKGIFDQEAIRAFSKWKFVPATVEGMPVRSENHGYCMDFKLE